MDVSSGQASVCTLGVSFPPLQVFFTCKTSVRKEAVGEEHQQRQRRF